jgi:hypothetical protein
VFPARLGWHTEIGLAEKIVCRVPIGADSSMAGVYLNFTVGGIAEQYTLAFLLLSATESSTAF